MMNEGPKKVLMLGGMLSQSLLRVMAPQLHAGGGFKQVNPNPAPALLAIAAKAGLFNQVEESPLTERQEDFVIARAAVKNAKRAVRNLRHSGNEQGTFDDYVAAQDRLKDAENALRILEGKEEL